MSLRGLFFLACFALAIAATPWNPFWGVLAYLGHYYLWPDSQWWGIVLAAMGVRLSLSVAVLTGLSIALHWTWLRTKTVGPLWHRQDVLMWLYIAAIGLSLVWGLPTDPAFEQKTDVFQKMIKVAIFAFMLTHVVTTPTELKRVLWFMFCVGGVYLAVAAKELPPSSFNEGRLDHFGGPDFFDSNCIAAHFVVMGILGVALLLTSSGLWTRLMCLGGGALIVNAIILARSRGAFLGIGAAGLAALVLADRQIRKHVAWLMPLVIVAGLYLADSDFLERMGTITADAEQRDRSAETRLLIWQSAWSMFLDHPFGVGAGNFYSIIGQYSADLAGRDTHNTFLRCLAELGLPGAAVLVAMFVNAFRILQRCRRSAEQLQRIDLARIAIGLQLSLVALLVSGMTVTMCYMEALFHFLLLPVCCQRAISFAHRERDELAIARADASIQLEEDQEILEPIA